MPRVVIVGGGITGLTAAQALAAHARESGASLACTVVEKDPRWGGKVHTVRRDNFIIEAGPDAVLRRKPWAVALCRRLGIEERLVPTANSGAFVRRGDALVPLPEGLSFLVPTRLGPFARSPLFSSLGKLRLAAEYALPPRRSGDDESLGEFIRRRLGREALEWLAEPLLSGIYAGNIDELSLLSTFPQLRTMEEEHGGLLRAALAQRKKAAAGSAPQSSEGESPFVSLKGGLSTLVETLIENLDGHELIAGDGVVRLVQPQDDGPRFVVALESGREIPADAVVLAAPAFVQSELLAELAPEAASELRRIDYASVANVVLAYPRAAVGRSMDGTGYLVPRINQRAVTACTWASEKWAHVAPPDQVLLRFHFGKAGREVVTEWSDERLVGEALREAQECMDVRREPEFTQVFRWPRAMPQYTVGHLDRVAVIERAVASVGGIVVTGAAFRGLGLPDCVRQAEAAAQSVLAFLNVGR